MTDHMDAAIEAVLDARVERIESERRNEFQRPPRFKISSEEVDNHQRAEILSDLAAAEPHLRKKWAEEISDQIKKNEYGLAIILDDFLTNATWESSGAEMARRITSSIEKVLE